MFKTTAFIGLALLSSALFSIVAREDDPKPLSVELGGHLADMNDTSG